MCVMVWRNRQKKVEELTMMRFLEMTRIIIFMIEIRGTAQVDGLGDEVYMSRGGTLLILIEGC